MTDRIWNRHFVSVLILNTLNFFAFYITATILSKYLIGIGIATTVAGFIVGLFSITSLCVRPFSGVMSDRLNNLTILKISNLLIALGNLGFVFSTNVTPLIFFRIISGIGFAFSGTCQISLASRYIPDKKLGEGIGYMGLGMVIGSAVAPGIGLAIADAFGMNATFLVSTILALTGFIILGFFKMERQENVKSSSICFTDIIALKAIPFTMVSSVFSFVNGIIASYLVLYSDEIGVKGISLYFTVYAAVLFMVRPFAGKIMDRFGIRSTVVPGIILTSLSMFMLGRVSSLALIIVTAVIRSVGQGSGQPSLQAACIEIVGKEKSGVATSTYYLGGDIAQGIGPMIGGFVLESIIGVKGYITLFDSCGLLLVIALFYFIYLTSTGKAERALS